MANINEYNVLDFYNECESKVDAAKATSQLNALLIFVYDSENIHRQYQLLAWRDQLTHAVTLRIFLDNKLENIMRSVGELKLVVGNSLIVEFDEENIIESLKNDEKEGRITAEQADELHLHDEEKIKAEMEARRIEEEKKKAEEEAKKSEESSTEGEENKEETPKVEGEQVPPPVMPNMGPMGGMNPMMGMLGGLFGGMMGGMPPMPPTNTDTTSNVEDDEVKPVENKEEVAGVIDGEEIKEKAEKLDEILNTEYSTTEELEMPEEEENDEKKEE